MNWLREDEHLKQLLMLGFSDRFRALELLPQLRRLRFPWSASLEEAIAVEIDPAGGLKLFQGLRFDAFPARERPIQWVPLLNAILPFPTTIAFEHSGCLPTAQELTDETRRWVEGVWGDPHFVRDAAALLQPGTSALMAIMPGEPEVLAHLSGYSHFLIHTRLQ
jgi:uncharacterized membrane protein